MEILPFDEEKYFRGELNLRNRFPSLIFFLQMLATIVTYELVLLQFDSDPNEQVDNILNADECVL